MLFIITVVDTDGDVHPLTVAVTVYVPAKADTTPGRMGLCCVAENPFGPVQLYEAPKMLLALRFRLSPIHNGPLLDATGAAGTAFTDTYVVNGPSVPQPGRETVTE